MYRTRQYFTKGDFKELVNTLEEYVGVTSFFTSKSRERTYYITTKENFKNFIGEKYGR